MRLYLARLCRDRWVTEWARGMGAICRYDYATGERHLTRSAVWARLMTWLTPATGDL